MERPRTPRFASTGLALAALTLFVLHGSVARAQARADFEIDVDGDAPEDSTTAQANDDDAAAPTDPGVGAGEDDQARALFQAGTAYYERGEYHEAYGQFVRAFEISQRPVLMYNASQAAERDGDLQHAVEWLVRFVNSPDAEQAERDRQRPRLANLRRRLEAQPPTPHEPDADDAFFMPVPAFVAYLVGGAGLLTFATFGILTLHEDSSLSTTCDTRACTSSDLSNLHTFAHATDAGWIVGVAGVAAGTILWLTLKGDSHESSSGVAFEPWLSPRLVGAGATLRF